MQEDFWGNVSIHKHHRLSEGLRAAPNVIGKKKKLLGFVPGEYTNSPVTENKQISGAMKKNSAIQEPVVI